MPRPTIITLAADAPAKEQKFFEETFGWKPSPASTGDLVLYDFDGYALAIYPREALADDAGVPGEGSGFEGITLSVNTASEAEVDKFTNLGSRYGGRIEKKAQKASWGGYHSYLRTPAGHLLEIAFAPFWPLGPDGRLRLK